MMSDINIEILVILRHYFKLGLQPTEGNHRIQNEEGSEKIFDCTTQNWFIHFKGDDLSLEIKPRSR